MIKLQKIDKISCIKLIFTQNLHLKGFTCVSGIYKIFIFCILAEILF